MLVVMESGVSEADVERVIDHLIGHGFDVHRSSGVTHTVLGGIGGREDFDASLIEAMPGVREARRITAPWKLAARAGKPDGTQVRIGDLVVGGGEPVTLPATWALREIGESQQVALLSTYADGFVVRAKAMGNSALLWTLGQSRLPVVLERAESAGVNEWLAAAETILAGGNGHVILCESGVATFAGRMLDIGVISRLKRLTHLPVIAAPGRVAAKPEDIAALSRAALAAGADGIWS